MTYRELYELLTAHDDLSKRLTVALAIRGVKGPARGERVDVGANERFRQDVQTDAVAVARRLKLQVILELQKNGYDVARISDEELQRVVDRLVDRLCGGQDDAAMA